MTIGAQCCQYRVGRLRGIEGHAQQRRALAHPLQMLGQPEHGRAAIRGGIGADALEHAAAVMHGVGGQAGLRGITVDECAVEPGSSASARARDW